MDVSVKSVGVLIDELITTNIKCFMAQDRLMAATADDAACAAAARQAQQLNARRCALIRAIDSKLDSATATLTEKTYG